MSGCASRLFDDINRDGCIALRHCCWGKHVQILLNHFLHDVVAVFFFVFCFNGIDISNLQERSSSIAVWMCLSFKVLTALQSIALWELYEDPAQDPVGELHPLCWFLWQHRTLLMSWPCLGASVPGEALDGSTFQMCLWAVIFFSLWGFMSGFMATSQSFSLFRSSKVLF